MSKKKKTNKVHNFFKVYYQSYGLCILHTDSLRFFTPPPLSPFMAKKTARIGHRCPRKEAYFNNFSSLIAHSNLMKLGTAVPCTKLYQSCSQNLIEPSRSVFCLRYCKQKVQRIKHLLPQNPMAQSIDFYIINLSKRQSFDFYIIHLSRNLSVNLKKSFSLKCTNE